jgi:hypothetical protein
MTNDAEPTEQDISQVVKMVEDFKGDDRCFLNQYWSEILLAGYRASQAGIEEWRRNCEDWQARAFASGQDVIDLNNAYNEARAQSQRFCDRLSAAEKERDALAKRLAEMALLVDAGKLYLESSLRHGALPGTPWQDGVENLIRDMRKALERGGGEV